MNEQHLRSIAWAVDQIMEVCTEIGCSGISPDLCRKHPERCSIIRKLMEASDADETKPKESGQITAGTGQGEGADYLYLERGLGRNMGDGL